MILLYVLMFTLTLSVLLCLFVPTKRQLFSTRFITMSLIIMVTAFSCYAYLGSAEKLPSYWRIVREQQQVQEALAELKTPLSVIHKLQTQLARHPEDAKGWYLLGRLYLVTRQVDHACDAFKKSIALEPQNPDALVQYAQALFIQNHMRMTTQSRALVHQALKLSPDHPQAINLIASNAYAQGDFVRAKKNWLRLKKILGDDSPDRKTIDEALEAIKKHQK